MTTTTPPPNYQRSWLPAGTRLNNTYEIDRPVGTGGMGEIYQGHEIGTNHSVAIKLLLPEFAENDSALALFGREASALRQLQHEAIVRYYIFAVEQVLQRPFLAMEFVEGRSLSAILDDDGPLPIETAHALLKRIASGLQAAHERGIIHRDVSPDNIIVPNADVTRAKIIDFGIARLTEFQEGTVIGSGFAGKYNWVSPEQLGLVGGNVTAKSDIYSLGLVMVHVLTGHSLNMGGTQLEIIDKRRRVPDLGAVDMRFRPLLEKMLQPHPDRRPDSMAAVANWPLGSSGLLRNFKSSEARRSATVRSAAKGSGGRGLRYATAALLLLALLGGGAGGLFYYAPDWFSQWSTILRPTEVTKEPDATPPPKPDAPPESGPPQTAPIPSLPPIDIGPGRLPPSTGPVRETKSEGIKRYVEQYDGGDCFFVAPVAVSERFATIEGFGASVRAFEALNSAFKRDIGFVPDVGMRVVTEAQCPAITFLSRLRGERARAPRLEIDNIHLRSGDYLSGNVSGFGGRNIELFLVSDGGTVQNVTNLLKPGTDAKTFDIGMSRKEGPAGEQPQLLIAVASPRPIPALRPPGPVSANQFFQTVLAEEARNSQGLAASAKYFQLDR